MEEEVGLSLKDQVEDLEKLADEYEKGLQLFKLKTQEIEFLDREILLGMHHEDIEGYCWELSKYAATIQRELNKHISRYNFTDTNLNRYLDQHANLYKGFSWPERRAEVINNSDYAYKLFSFRNKCKFECDRLSFLPGKIEFMIKIARDIAYGKRRFEGGDRS